MKITGYQTWAARVPYEEGPRYGSHLVLQLRTDEGLTGLSYLGMNRDALTKTVVESMAESVLGEEALDIERLNKRLLGRGGLGGITNRAAGAIDVALWDIKGKALGQPLWRLLGGYSNKVKAYAGWRLWWQYDLESLARNAADHAKNGFTHMKYRIGGMNTLDAAVERTKVMRDAVGPDVELIVDANGSWSVGQAISYGREMGKHKLFWFEDPTTYLDYDGATMIGRALDSPVCVGESFTNPGQFVTQLEQRGVNYYMIDLNVGGLTPWMKCAHLCEAYNRPVASHLTPEVLCHAVAAIPNGLIVEFLPWATPLFQGAPEPKDGVIELSERPGLGMELDMDALSRYAA
jgi:L-alanine-DL-glutamate epimerase-like enolase superfamily enzyme